MTYLDIQQSDFNIYGLCRINFVSSTCLQKLDMIGPANLETSLPESGKVCRPYYCSCWTRRLINQVIGGYPGLGLESYACLLLVHQIWHASNVQIECTSHRKSDYFFLKCPVYSGEASLVQSFSSRVLFVIRWCHSTLFLMVDIVFHHLS